MNGVESIKMLSLQKGAKVDLTKNNPFLTEVIVGLGWKANSSSMEKYDLDASVFLIGKDGKCNGDSDIVFYGNPKGRKEAVVHSGDNSVGGRDAEQIYVDLTKIPEDVEKLSFVITIHEGEKKNQFFSQVQDAYVRVIDKSQNIELVRFDLGNSFSKETAVIVGEIYRYKGDWKFVAVGSGFYGGLAALCTSFGLEVEEENVDNSNIVKSSKEIIAKSEENKDENKTKANVNLTKIDLLKKKVTVVLEKKNIHKEKARVVAVIDASGSMSFLYSKGTVQNAFERTLAVASAMDEDGEMDVWFFGDKFMRAPMANIGNFEGYVKKVYPSPRLFGGVGCGNNEPRVMRDLIKKCTEEQPLGGVPTFVIFFSDGGIYKDSEISKILIESSRLPIFWQFVGIGNANYGVLRKLDTLKGRFIDNAGFFALDDLDRISDEELYERLLNEFPLWIKEARNKNIL